MFFVVVLITFSTSIYIMCVCLFSALSRRVGALQISIIIMIIIIIKKKKKMKKKKKKTKENPPGLGINLLH